MMAFPMHMEAGGASGALAKMEGCPSGGMGTLVYFSCEDCGNESSRAVSAGGKVFKPKMSIGQYGFIALVTDTEGNMIGLHSMQQLGGREAIKYLLLIYSEEGIWPPYELEVARDESVQLCQRLHKQGQYPSAAPLHPISTATCVRVRDGQRIVSDGPYAETKEQLAGYFLIDVASLDEAISVAERIPGTTRGTTEIRPIVELPGLP